VGGTASALEWREPEAVPPARAGEFRPLGLGPLEIWPPVALAPMAGVTNYAFRRLCREFGAGLYVSEMITARGFLEGNSLTRLLASSRPDERPRSVQIYGTVPGEVEETARVLAAEGVDHVDVNFGCPVPKVTRHGGGSAIPVKPRLMAALVRGAVRGAGRVPVTVKVRKGIDDGLLTFRDAGRVAEEEGAAAIGLHGRTAAQLYTGAADWEAIAELKASVGIPVLGNGDVWEATDALRMMRTTGCDGVIVGRGCLGRPWLFAELAAVFDGRPPPDPPRFGAIAAVMARHAEGLIELFGRERAMLQMRKWATWYVAGFRGAAAARAALTRVETPEEMRAILARLDPAEPYRRRPVQPAPAPARPTRVRLPEGYLDDRDDDAPPAPPPDAAAYARALDGG
jgi:nifR3 family TIM-barrel protein